MRLLSARTASAVLLSVGLAGCADHAPLGVSAELPSSPAARALAAASGVRFSEIHYDNTGTDTGEAIEITGPAGTDLSGWSVVLYNGNGGAVYGTRTLSGSIPATCDSEGVVVLEYPTNGIQNGSPDGFTLVNAAGAVVEFLSYEGAFAAVGGAADGMTSTDIGVQEPSDTPIGESLQREGDSWQAPKANTFGACNAAGSDGGGDGGGGGGGGTPSSVFLSELHYDNDGTDTGEAVEITGPAGTDLTGWSLVLYNGNGGGSYDTKTLSGTIPATCGAVVIDYPSNGIQNGSPDGLALVDATGAVIEFLSYEGTFTAANGPAAGMTPIDIGVAESSGTSAGFSLQRDSAGAAWTGPAQNTFVTCAAGGGSTGGGGSGGSSITIVGRNGSDPPLPVGFQDQLFASFPGSSGATITWTSETPLIASIDADGVVTALSAGTATIRATASTGETGTIALPTRIAVASTTAEYDGNAEFGIPMDGTPGDDFIVTRDQYTASYSYVRNTPNWVSYNLEISHFGPADRCDCFTPDPQLPAGYTTISTADYTGSGTVAGFGIDRGHLVRSFDRTAASLDNAVTYYFSNIIPQTADNNQGPWSELEIYLGNLARFDNQEVYIIAGVAGSNGTLKNEGKVIIPESVWKIAVIMPKDQGLEDVDDAGDLEVIAVNMPNVPGIRDERWTSYETTVDAIEALTGYDFLALLPDAIERAVESDNAPPTADAGGPYTGLPGLPVQFDGRASTDPEDDALAFRWSFGDGTTATGAIPTHSYSTAGSYTATLVVTDAAGAADTATAAVTIQTPQQAVETMVSAINAMENAGALTRGTSTALSASLEAAAASLDKGNRTAAVNQLEAFLHKLAAAEKAQRISAEDAAALRAAATRVIQSVSNM